MTAIGDVDFGTDFKGGVEICMKRCSVANEIWQLYSMVRMKYISQMCICLSCPGVCNETKCYHAGDVSIYVLALIAKGKCRSGYVLLTMV